MKFDFELRRLIFGLSSIISTPAAAIPALVAQRLPDITKELVNLSLKMREERKKILDDNEDHIEEEKANEGKNSDDEDEDIVESEEEEDENESVNKILKKISQAKKGE